MTVDWALAHKWSDHDAAFVSPDGQLKLNMAKFFNAGLLRPIAATFAKGAEGPDVVAAAEAKAKATPQSEAAKAKKQRQRAKTQAASLRKQSMGCLVAT